MGWIETNFSQNAGTAHPLEQMRASSNQIIVFTAIFNIRQGQLTQF
jgi:hypothetical protein